MSYTPVPEHVERERFTRPYRKYSRPMIGLFWFMFLCSLYEWLFSDGKIQYPLGIGIGCATFFFAWRQRKVMLTEVYELFRRNEVVQGEIIDKNPLESNFIGKIPSNVVNVDYVIEYEYMNQTYQVSFNIPNENFAPMYRSDKYKIPKIGDQLYVYINSDTHATVYPVTSQLFKE